ncbi:MAG: DegV family protein [Anaerolineales bacterium]|nr:DegV family protein [Anaerolineales bacterium]
MSKIAIITDSTAYIPKDLVEKYPIWVAPLMVIFGDKTFEDGVDIQPEEFYNRLKTESVNPTTSQVTPASFNKLFSELVPQEYEILCVLVSDKLSATIDSAVKAREDFPNAKIEIVNSNSITMALGFQALAAARAAKEGADLAECKAVAEQARDHTGVVFAVETLEFLHRGGRIGGGARFLGTALNLKPILEIRDGRVEALERVRTRNKSLTRLIELVEERTKGQSPIRLASLHANAPEEAKAVLEEASKRVGAVEEVFSEVSPVVGTHTGPGVVGLAYMAGL